MPCLVSCAVALVFLIGSLWMSFRIDKTSITMGMNDLLTPAQQQTYLRIIERRRELYLQGLALGAGLSLLLLLLRRSSSSSSGWSWTDGCLVVACMFLTSYFYYTLSDKPQLLVVQLETEEKRKKWAEVYRVMSTTYHTGLLLGVIAVVLLSRGVMM